jgi:hypothetical protein
MVAQEEPVEKLIIEAVINVTAGRSTGVKIPEVRSTIYSPVFISAHTSPIVQANTRIIQAIIMDRIPLIQASIAFIRDNSPPLTDIMMAINPARNEPQIRLALASEFPMILRIVFGESFSRPSLPVINKPQMVITSIAKIGIRPLLQ